MSEFARFKCFGCTYWGKAEGRSRCFNPDIAQPDFRAALKFNAYANLDTQHRFPHSFSALSVSECGGFKRVFQAGDAA